jgi:hypothetical protein
LTVAARVGPQDDIRQDLQNYNREVIRLQAGRFAVLSGEVSAGAGTGGGVFYGLIPGSESLGNILRRDELQAAGVVAQLETAERIWTEARPQSSTSIEEIRHSLVSDEEMRRIAPALDGISWQDFEKRQIQVRMCCQHRDLHCENVMVTAATGPAMIDYSEVGTATAVLDPVTLELGTLFHPASHVRAGAWPTVAQAERWDDLDFYLTGCPIPSFIKATRGWADRVGAGKRELYATVYAFAVRQLKYPTGSPELAVGIVRGVIAAYQRT